MVTVACDSFRHVQGVAVRPPGRVQPGPKPRIVHLLAMFVRHELELGARVPGVGEQGQGRLAAAELHPAGTRSSGRPAPISR